MGGKGSGTWYRGNKQTTTEEVKRIDVRYMKQRGLLSPNAAGNLSWNCQGKPTGNINYTCYQGHLQLNYRYKDQGREWLPVLQHIPIDRTPCYFGGERLWFLCPCCNRRIGVLYYKNNYFLCRHCCQLSYPSQLQGNNENLLAKMQKLGQKTFAYYEYGEGFGKKKGMHWKTFNRLCAHYEAIEQQWFEVVNLQLSNL